MLSDTAREQNITDVTKEINAIDGIEMPAPHEDLCESFDCVDDITSKPLNHTFAAEARKLETDFFKRMRVY